MIVGEVTEEATDDLALLISEIRHIVELMDITKKGEHLVGRCHVLVHIIEVGQQQLSPAIEMIERLVDACALGEAAVQFADQQDGVGHL